MAKKQFAIWTVNGEDYKLKLSASKTCALEEKLGTGIINLITNGGVPSLKVMLLILHHAMQQWNASIKLKDVEELFDKYVDEGGSHLALFSDVILDVFKVSGFFSQTQVEKMEEAQEQAQDLL